MLRQYHLHNSNMELAAKLRGSHSIASIRKKLSELCLRKSGRRRSAATREGWVGRKAASGDALAEAKAEPDEDR